MQSGNAHLGHDLQHAFGHALLVGVHHIRIVLDVIRIRQVAIAPGIPQCLEREIGIDGVGAESHQQTVVMDFPRFARFHDQAHAGAAGGSHQVVMHRAGGGQGADRHSVRIHVVIGKHEQLDAVRYRLRGFRTNAIQRTQQSVSAGIALEGDVDGARVPTAMVDGLYRFEFVVG